MHTFKVGDFVRFYAGDIKVLGQVIDVNQASEHNSWRKHPEQYPVVVRVANAIKPLPGSVELQHFTFGLDGYATKWEQLAQTNRLETL